jgi:HEAT repeat protein
MKFRITADLLEILDKKLYPSSYDTLAIAVTLTHFSDPRILDTVVQLYKEAKESLKGSYIKILGCLKDRRALPILEKALQDKNRSVRAYAEWGIYQINITQE